MLKTLRRLVDRHRHADGDYGWLFRPYTGEELVALAVQSSDDARHAEPLAIAAVCLRGDRVLTRESLELRLVTPQGRGAETPDRRSGDPDEEVTIDQALARLLDFVGNRPLVSWRLDHDLAVLNRSLRRVLGFELPNAGIDLAQRYQRHHPASGLEVPSVDPQGVLGAAITTALMHRRLERATAPVRHGA
ncbi:3'-5' exonuclease [Halomonas borealis]|uniref:3'-5' exonuclease n=1 Tax=Halomonas borealis TaxID=2508710 RepID=UPI00109F0348|nr:3'-5' exonuclease [Halomonas borealis]